MLGLIESIAVHYTFIVSRGIIVGSYAFILTGRRGPIAGFWRLKGTGRRYEKALGWQGVGDAAGAGDNRDRVTALVHVSDCLVSSNKS